MYSALPPNRNRRRDRCLSSPKSPSVPRPYLIALEVDIAFQLRAARIELMIICHCVGVTERRIRLIALNGGCTRERVAEMCGAGTCCGGCQPAIDEIIQE